MSKNVLQIACKAAWLSLGGAGGTQSCFSNVCVCVCVCVCVRARACHISTLVLQLVWCHIFHFAVYFPCSSAMFTLDVSWGHERQQSSIYLINWWIFSEFETRVSPFLTWIFSPGHFNHTWQFSSSPRADCPHPVLSTPKPWLGCSLPVWWLVWYMLGHS